MTTKQSVKKRDLIDEQEYKSSKKKVQSERNKEENTKVDIKTI